MCIRDSHDAVLFQGVEAAAVELTGEQALAGAEGIGGVHDDEVVFLLALADELEGVLKIDVHPAVIHPAGEMCIRDSYNAPYRD